MVRKLLMLTIGILLAGGISVNAELSGDQIMAKVDQQMSSGNFKCLMEITVSRPDRGERTSKIQVTGKGVDKVLVRYLAPVQDKGQGYLRVGDDAWYYLPNAGKSIRISGKNSLNGSDLSVDDVMRLKLTEDYEAKVIGNEMIAGTNDYVLELMAKRPTVTYAKLKYWVRRADFLPQKFECYTATGMMLKTMEYSQVKEIGGRTKPAVMTVTSELKKNFKTTLTIIDADYNSAVPDEMFTRNSLEKGQ